jgi:chemotaxis regulatin CheY-phosphate phosphatase CheZ
VDARAYLNEVIKHTGEAAHTIMDACDKLIALASGIGGEKETQIIKPANRIYSACTFQNITSQHIRKVITLLENIGARTDAAAGDDKNLLNGAAL